MRKRLKPVAAVVEEPPMQVGGYDNTPSVPQFANYPTMQTAGPAYAMPNTGAFPVVGNGMPMGLPQYTSYDEYGRAYSPAMTYGPQPNSAPVPIPTPSMVVQLTPIISPVAFVPYNTQNEPLYQWDSDIDE